MENTSSERLFSLPFDEVQSRAHLLLGHGRTYQSRLATKDPDLTTTWFEAFEDSIEAAEAAAPIEERRAAGKDKTDTQTLSMKQARQVLQDLFFYVRKAYRDSEAKQQLFGTDLYDDASYNVGKMKTLLELAYKAATEPAQQAVLTQAGYSDTDRQTLGSLAGALTTAQTLAGLQRGTNQVSTEDYVRLHNVVWQRMKTLNEAANRVFVDQEAPRGLFRLYPAASNETPAPASQ